MSTTDTTTRAATTRPPRRAASARVVQAAGIARDRDFLRALREDASAPGVVRVGGVVAAALTARFGALAPGTRPGTTAERSRVVVLHELDDPEDVVTVPDQRPGDDWTVRVGEADDEVDPVVVRSVD
ncbi:hypothetical protein [Umezawaea beigongshangensis]|uniref:hypothetical protein n=1 Tax=Umezawaea beigongshangensis TaxID=2780383 RepID=UPI0018F24A82|nr:hypothetical protein [Umezawaea beigongshangensis]